MGHARHRVARVVVSLCCYEKRKTSTMILPIVASGDIVSLYGHGTGSLAPLALLIGSPSRASGGPSLCYVEARATQAVPRFFFLHNL
jgi:hypothetical protein